MTDLLDESISGGVNARELRDIYAKLRTACIHLEELIESGENRRSCLTESDLKRLDRSVTVMKVAFKLVKKVIKKHGLTPSKFVIAAGG